jgi:IrrE N-terminal-like domain
MMTQERIESEIVSVALGVRELPVDLYKIAKDIRVGDVRPTDFRQGFTDFSPAAPVIYLNYKQLGTTWRFVFAHELAHVMLRMPEVIRLMRMRGRTNLLVDEEALADRVAATLLIPDNCIEALRKTCRPLRQLLRAARVAEVSVMTLVARMASSDIDIALLHWRKANDTWHVVDRPGTPPSLHGYVKPSAIGYSAIEDLGREESDLVVDCRVNDRHAKISGRGYRHREHAFHFLEPSVDIWIAPEQTERHSQSSIYDLDNRCSYQASSHPVPLHGLTRITL